VIPVSVRAATAGDAAGVSHPGKSSFKVATKITALSVTTHTVAVSWCLAQASSQPMVLVGDLRRQQFDSRRLWLAAILRPSE